MKQHVDEQKNRRRILNREYQRRHKRRRASGYFCFTVPVHYNLLANLIDNKLLTEQEALEHDKVAAVLALLLDRLIKK
jgi:hypothetical protein